MNLDKLIILIPIVVFLSSCTTLGTTPTHSKNLKDKSVRSDQLEVPNQFIWNSSNCAHVMADGRCAHPTGATGLDNKNSSFPTKTPNMNEINSSNCAHILADGTCAHPL